MVVDTHDSTNRTFTIPDPPYGASYAECYELAQQLDSECTQFFIDEAERVLRTAIDTLRDHPEGAVVVAMSRLASLRDNYMTQATRIYDEYVNW